VNVQSNVEASEASHPVERLIESRFKLAEGPL
jgi:hypothetical protein